MAIFTSVIAATWLISNIDVTELDAFVFFKAFKITIVCQLCLYYTDLYDLKITRNYRELSIRLLQAMGFTAIVLAVIYLIFPATIIGTGIFALSIGIVLCLVVSWRYSYSLILNKGLFNQKIIIIGSSEISKNIVQEIQDKMDCGYTISLELPESMEDCEENCNYEINDFENGNLFVGLCEKAKKLGVEKIIVAVRDKRKNFPLRELLKCRIEGIEVLEGNSFYELLSGKLIVKHINPGWLIFSEGFRKSRFRLILKRLLDICLATILILLFLPIVILTAMTIKIDSKGPVIFSQERIGQRKRPYKILKFRSMIINAEKYSGPVWAEDDDPRTTRIGKVLRTLRIDEIPQLWNVLRGDMSFVGPRPEREFFVKQLEKEIPYYRERFSVKPGITGWAQVCYRYGATVEDAIEKLNYDLFYIKNMSLLMDLMIVLRTIKIVIFGTGAR